MTPWETLVTRGKFTLLMSVSTSNVVLNSFSVLKLDMYT